MTHPKGAHAHFLADFNYPNFLPWLVFLCICLAFVIHLPEDEGLTSTPLSLSLVWTLGLTVLQDQPGAQLNKEAQTPHLSCSLLFHSPSISSFQLRP